MLQSGGQAAEGGIIILMTDGDENAKPSIGEVLPALKMKKVIVNTMALGATADKGLERLAVDTKGKAYSFRDLQGNIQTSMESAFIESTTAEGDENSRPFMVR